MCNWGALLDPRSDWNGHLIFLFHQSSAFTRAQLSTFSLTCQRETRPDLFGLTTVLSPGAHLPPTSPWLLSSCQSPFCSRDLGGTVPGKHQLPRAWGCLELRNVQSCSLHSMSFGGKLHQPAQAGNSLRCIWDAFFVGREPLWAHLLWELG